MILALIVGASVLVSAGVYNYFVLIEADNINVSALFVYNSGSGDHNAENYVDTWDLTADLNAGGDITTRSYSLTLSGDSDFNRTAFFIITLLEDSILIPHNGSEGVTITITDEALNEVTSFEFTPSSSQNFLVTIELDEMCASGIFEFSLEISNTP